MTATPKDEIDKNTYTIFDLERGVPTYAYELDEAVKEGYLGDYRTREYKTKIMEEGIHYDQLSEEEKEAFDDEAALLAAGVQTIKTWQAQGYETIAVVCRDEAEAADTARKLKQYVPVVEEDLETAEFGEGVMVLPVAYTKGLEFDAVLLLDPTEEKYPENDGQVKLLYVAATRALHELAVRYTGELTGIRVID